MIISVAVCIASLFVLLWMLRRDQLSFGLPFAFLVQLLLVHVPGAVAHMVGGAFLRDTEYVEIGIQYAALGVVTFVIGVAVARGGPKRAPAVPADRRGFAMFCVIGGSVVVYALAPLSRIPSLGAMIMSGGAIWMLGTMIAFRSAQQMGRINRILVWSIPLVLYIVTMLLLGGFLSYGALAAIVVMSALVIGAQRLPRVVIGIALVSAVGLTIFVNYFENRDHIRESVWGGASMTDRIDSVLSVGSTFHIVDFGNEEDLAALDERLNQNMFVGIAVQRLQQGQVNYLNGSSVWDGVISLVPRVFWPDKPVTGGSGDLVMDLTGLRLNEDTSWGVGAVLEYYGNFGIGGLICGFFLMGWLLGTTDLRAALAERRGDLSAALLWFLPSVPLVGGGTGSLMETIGASGAAVVAAYAWRWGWRLYQMRERQGARRMAPRPVLARTEEHGNPT